MEIQIRTPFFSTRRETPESLEIGTPKITHRFTSQKDEFEHFFWPSQGETPGKAIRRRRTGQDSGNWLSENSSQISFSKRLFRALFLAILRDTPRRSAGGEEPGCLETGQAKIPHRFPSQKGYFEHFF